MITAPFSKRWAAILTGVAFCSVAHVASAQDDDAKEPAADTAAEEQEADEKSPLEVVTELIQAKELNEAATKLQAALADDPESRQLQIMRQRLAMSFASTRKYAEALEQMQALFEFRSENMKGVGDAQALASYASMINSFASRARKPEVAKAALETAMSAVEDQIEENPQLWNALTQLVNAKAMWLSSNGDRDAGNELMRAHLERLAEVDQSDQASEATAQSFAQMLTTLASRETDSDKEADLRQQLDEYTTSLLTKYPDSSAMQTLYANTQFSQIMGTYRDDPEAAQARIVATFELLETAAEDNAGLKSTLSRMKSYERRIESALKVARMIGNPAPPLQVAGWGNTEEFSADSLEGKVVLYDFWAVWCGPCVATFPHLREWQEEFGDQGFQVVGITRYYNYEWDEEAEKAVRSQDDVDPEIEHDAVANFLQSHELQHPTIFVPKDGTLQAEYGVTGIPHAVLIDRQGRVQMVKVGSGSANAEALHEKIKELIAE